MIRELLSSFAGELGYVWRHLPLNDIHPTAQIAAEAAAAQGRFWETQDLLDAHSGDLGPRELAQYAEQLGRDNVRFIRELRGREHAVRVSEDLAGADESAVAGTPTPTSSDAAGSSV